ncbi:hypothetical protein ACTJKB_04170 [Paenibacillus sp. 22594]
MKLLAALAGILVGVVAAEIITGGAITAALPMIINLITVYLQADAIKSVAQTIVQASGYIGTYLSQGWQKMIEPAAIALATALAMGLVELAMELGFKAIGKGLNKAGQAVKKGVGAAATGAKKIAGEGVKGIKSLLKTGAKLASKSGSMIIRNGKIVIKSLQKGLMKGAKKLQGLVDRILQKFKFKRFKLERKGKHIRLYGEVNPWVLLVDGELRDIDEKQLEKEIKKLELDGKKPIKLSETDYKKLEKLDATELEVIAKHADGNKDKIDFKSVKKTDNDLLSSNGKFKDAKMQSKYDEYCERKYRAGETPKDPLEWKEASEKWASLREQGEIFSDESFAKFSQQYENAQKEITIVTNEGTKIRVDAIATDDHGNVIIQEYKSSDTAPYTPNQGKGFPELEKSGGSVVGEGKGDFTEGYEIPSGTTVQTVRPEGKTYSDE